VLRRETNEEIYFHSLVVRIHGFCGRVHLFEKVKKEVVEAVMVADYDHDHDHDHDDVFQLCVWNENKKQKKD
jgi:hypothetical protein